MRSDVMKSLLWQGVGLLLYFGGMLLFLVVAVSVYLAPPANSLENMSLEHLVPIAASILLLVLGRTVSWKFGGEYGGIDGIQGVVTGNRPERSQLERLGYHVPPESSDDESGQAVGDDSVACPQCGAENERGFHFCSRCATELPE